MDSINTIEIIHLPPISCNLEISSNYTILSCTLPIEKQSKITIQEGNHLNQDLKENLYFEAHLKLDTLHGSVIQPLKVDIQLKKYLESIIKNNGKQLNNNSFFEALGEIFNSKHSFKSLPNTNENTSNRKEINLDLKLSSSAFDIVQGKGNEILKAELIRLDLKLYELYRIILEVSSDLEIELGLGSNVLRDTELGIGLKVLRNQWFDAHQELLEMEDGSIMAIKAMDMTPITYGFISEKTEIYFYFKNSGTTISAADLNSRNLFNFFDKDIVSISKSFQLTLDSKNCFDEEYLQHISIPQFNHLINLPDVHNFIFVSPETASEFNLKNGSWIKLSTSMQQDTHIREACAIVHDAFSFLPKGYFSCTNLLEFNIRKTLQGGQSNDLLTCFVDHIDDLESSIYSFATQCILTEIKSPNNFTEHENKCSHYSLESHFSSNRGQYLIKDDIICIPHISNPSSYPDEEFEDKLYFDNLRKDFSYFVVSSIDGNYIKNDITNLIIQGEISMNLPKSNSLPFFFSFPAMVNKSKIQTQNDDSYPFSGHAALVHIFKLYNNKGSTSMSHFRPSILLTGKKGSGKRTFIHRICKRYGFHLTEINLFELLTESDLLTIENISHLFTVSNACSPCVLYLRNFEALSKENNNELTTQKNARKKLIEILSDLIQNRKTNSPLILVSSVRSSEHISKEFMRLFNHSENFDVFKDEDRAMFLENAFIDEGILKSMDIHFISIVKELLGGFQIHELLNLVRDCISELKDTYHYLIQGKSVLTKNIISKIVLKIQHQDYRKNTQQITIPKVSWDDIGGLENAKRQILDTIQLPLQKPHLFSSGMKKRSGVLLYGPPGCGKTLIAKAVATECKLNFLSVKGPELISMYIGESERNIRELFEKARQNQPSIIFFDELDALAPNRGKSGDAGGLMDRIVSQLLSELDQDPGENNNVFIMGATNRVDLVDNSLLRSGRFDVCVEVGICEGEDRLKVLRALTRKFKMESNINLEEIVSNCSEGMSGADFYALASNAMLNCILRKCKNGDSPDSEIIVQLEDFNESLKSINPSLTGDQVREYNRTE